MSLRRCRQIFQSLDDVDYDQLAGMSEYSQIIASQSSYMGAVMGSGS